VERGRLNEKSNGDSRPSLYFLNEHERVSRLRVKRGSRSLAVITKANIFWAVIIINHNFSDRYR